MRRILILIISSMFILCSCGGYNTPDVGILMDEICSSQGLTDMTSADDSGAGILFDIDLTAVTDYSVKYSSRGGYADMIAIFRLNGGEDTEAAAAALESYKAARYEDFKGYAPLEAEKVEKGRVITYGDYVLLLIVPDIDEALKTADTEFTK